MEDQTMDNYEKASQYVLNYISQNDIEYGELDDEIQAEYKKFQNQFSPEKLNSIPDQDLLASLFINQENKKSNLCYILEYDSTNKMYFGSISGGSSYKFTLFQNNTKKWMTGTSKNNKEISNEEAIAIAKKIRHFLINGCNLINSISLNTEEDYNYLDERLHQIDEALAEYSWIQKYFHMIYPDKIMCWYARSWQDHILRGLGIHPSSHYYVKNGQLQLICKKTGLNGTDFRRISSEYLGDIIHFYRLGSSDQVQNYSKQWAKGNYVAIGWPKLGDLKQYYLGNKLDKPKLTQSLGDRYYPNNRNVASRKAGEIETFLNTFPNDKFVIMNGNQLIGLVDHLGSYYYDPSTPMSHCRQGAWHQIFNPQETLPKPEGNLTTCVELKDPENVYYLYQRYFHPNEFLNTQTAKDTSKDIYHTGITSSFERNRIIFGAPGTGKSFTLNQDKDQLLINNPNNYERVTFYPDYTYAQFVGCYKPVSNKDTISYQFVPGPFMRIYAKALQSAQANNPEPYLLIIEEINRARVASVFGDIFQLLDRDQNQTSEYDIQPSEEIKQYLAHELKCDVSKITKIKLPDNLFIWATMNSADQGVFPIDTAFKRRWDFEYIDIDHNDNLITGAVDLIKDDPSSKVNWNTLRKAINNKLSHEFNINEDKLIGPFFISKNITQAQSSTNDYMPDQDLFRKVFKNKVLMYLYEDAARVYRNKLFPNCEASRYSTVCKAFDTLGLSIFGDDFKENYYDQA